MPDNPYRERVTQLRSRLSSDQANRYIAREALPTLLSYCTGARTDVDALAARLHSRFGTFSQVLDARMDDLAELDGMTPYAATFLKLISSLASYSQQERQAQRKFIRLPEDMGRYCASLCVNDTHEKMYAVALSDQGRLLGNWLIGSGIVSGLSITPRDVLRFALQSEIYAIVLTHNHPGGSLRPSKEDMMTTRRMSQLLASLNLMLLDHIIVASGKYASLTAMNLLESGSSDNQFVNDYLNALRATGADEQR